MAQIENISKNKNYTAVSIGRPDELTGHSSIQENSPEEHTTDDGERIAAEPEWRNRFMETERLHIVPLTPEEFLRLLTEDYFDPDTQMAMEYLYQETLTHIEKYRWYTNWQITLKEEDIVVGSACFKGEPDEDNQVEIGYGTDYRFRNQGYMTEAVKAMCEWAFSQPGVEAVIAETYSDNQASHRVLEKCGMSRFEHSCGRIWWRLRKSKKE
jgi:RimJ/RimL family protein N-acetyltransferase